MRPGGGTIKQKWAALIFQLPAFLKQGQSSPRWGRSLINRSRQALSPLIRPQSILIQATHSPLILVSDEVQLPSFSSPSLSALLSGLNLPFPSPPPGPRGPTFVFFPSLPRPIVIILVKFNTLQTVEPFSKPVEGI